MASTNQSPFYKAAQGKFLSAKNDEERLEALEEMMRECPKHKSSEAMLANLKTRHKKLQEKLDRIKKSKSSSGNRVGIKKEEMQAVIVGKTRVGKSSLISILTNSKPLISNSAGQSFTTKFPQVGMTDYSGVKIQIIELPAYESEYYDKGIANTADSLIILVDSLEQIKEIKQELDIKAKGKQIIVFNKIDLLSETEKRKLQATLQSKKYNFVLISCKTLEGIEELKEKLFKSFDRIRVYTKEPSKAKSTRPFVLNQGSTVKDVAEKIFHGFSKQIKETRITGPSSKFANQKVSLSHILKDLDLVEFKTK
jgi:small GTP-binding protein